MNDPIKKIVERVVKKYFPNEIDRSDAERLIEDIVQIININDDVNIDYLPSWYVSEYYVKKEDLPNIEEINKIYCQNCPYGECNEICDKMRIKITYAIVKRIRKAG